MVVISILICIRSGYDLYKQKAFLVLGIESSILRISSLTRPILELSVCLLQAARHFIAKVKKLEKI
ncbi:MAG: hypothetical protein DMG65_17080 [Candidatus Angelobacter sp. Gp1-AA117]|nr:MAG: hypothetical protein DMG65_17080 [Candidatus Angelobacter sp. Gp1-AA117]